MINQTTIKKKRFYSTGAKWFVTPKGLLNMSLKHGDNKSRDYTNLEKLTEYIGDLKVALHDLDNSNYDNDSVRYNKYLLIAQECTDEELDELLDYIFQKRMLRLL